MGTAEELAELDASAQAELVQRGELRPRELVEAAIERLQRLNPRLNAVIHVDLERALRLADAVDANASTAFPGVPMLMKDIGGAEAGQPCHAGMGLLKRVGFTEASDAYITRRFQAAGLCSLGRTNTPELAILPVTEPEAYGATRNPWSLAHSPGGSSGGSAAAVAAGIVPVAHASDGGGSIRGPASMCGLFGLKPSRGRASFGPGRGERWSGLSTEFVLTRSVRDAARMLEVVAGSMPGDPYAAPPPAYPFAEAPSRVRSGLRIGIMRRASRGIELHPEALAAADAAARALEGLGHRVDEAHPPALDDAAHVIAWMSLVSANTARALDAYGEALGVAVTADDVEPLTWALAEHARGVAGPQLLAQFDAMHRFGRDTAQFWADDGYDLLLTPTFAALPPEVGTIRSTADDPLGAYRSSPPYGVFTLPWNLTGQPAASLPTHVSSAGLPVGVQLVAAYGREDLLLSVCAQLEQAMPWAARRPPLFG